MKRFQLILILNILFLSVILAQSSSDSRYLKPTNFQKRVTTLVSEKTRYYYSLNTVEASIINVQGPGRLRVLTRGRFIPEEGEKIDYEIIYTLDGGEPRKIQVDDIERSKKATYLNGSLGVPGQLADFEIELGRGNHTIEFKLGGQKIPVALRYNFMKTKAKKLEWISYCAKQPSEPVDLISRESTVSYYRFSGDNPLCVEVNGPTQVRVLTRVENHYQMKGRIDYRLQVKENDKVINTYQLSSRRSEVAVYKDNDELIPGKAREFVIDVPKGGHTYEIYLLDKDKSSVLGRFLLPKKDVTLVN